jgi:uncharacterized protein (TIGR04255 family)
MAQRIYPNAPITEAIIDIRLRPVSEPTLEQLSKVQSGEEGRYPNKKKPIVFQFQVDDVNSEPRTSSSSSQIGQTFVSADGLNVFVARRDGLSVHRLKPYTHWAHFREEANRLWIKYKEIVQPQAIEMLLVRNINQIEVNDGEELQTVLKLFPTIPPELPQQLGNFAFTVDLGIDNGGRLILNEGVIPSIEPNKIRLLLDITAFKQAAPGENIDEAAIWSTLDRLRDAKDAAFEACITDHVRRNIS